MSFTAIFIGIAAITAATGVGESVKAGFDQFKAKKLDANSTARVEFASNRLQETRTQCGEALEALGREKVSVLNGSITHFLNSFSQLKNVDFTVSEGLEELNRLHIDTAQFDDLKVMSNLASSLVAGTVAGVAGGALVAFGAYSAAGALATASTGTAIASLSGTAATNATLAFFGGGSLAAGGMGIAGGTAVLGGLVAGPALMVMGTIIAAKAGQSLEKAKTNAAVTSETVEQLENGSLQCIAIRRRTYMFYSLLARLDTYFTPLLFAMDDIIRSEGTDYSKFSISSKKTVACAAATAVTIKAVLDTPILKDDGSVTEESGRMVGMIADKVETLEKQ